MNQTPDPRCLAAMEIFSLLATCYSTPVPELPKKIADTPGRLLPLGEDIAAQARQLAEALEGEDPQELLKDYSRLFVGPFELLAPPFGSVYLDKGRVMMGDSTREVLRHYREAGMNMSDGFKSPPDHVVAELEFLALQAYRTMEAETRGDPDSAREHADRLRNFFAAHPGRWLDRFASAVAQEAQTGFYRALGRFTGHILPPLRAAMAPDTSRP
ncbi:TorD/DmsD family molecular chaperone [Pseudodesulfovibrio pelocollis]|uniref:TorD/DmsD family molecular chaperone n=1 Tax=Pseudodesulfovibrio pelocollis TaxID=3051432 RepID=UPI00255AD69E|nr:molecular chaperone TorD family protein [Pseudodesulfovibrio sp. SB368]